MTILRKFNHKNLVRMVDLKVDFDRNRTLIAMELCNGGTLQEFVNERGRLSESEARFVMRQIVAGVLVLKGENCMHRDLKLSNVMVHREIDPSESGWLSQLNMDYCREFDFERDWRKITFKVADFGFAKNLGAQILTKTCCGTPTTMPPEQLEGKEYGHQAEVWSLGCMFYNLLTNQVPF